MSALPIAIMPRARADALVIVAKIPEPGMVKTRLATVIGPQGAADLYRAFLDDLAERFGVAQGVGEYDLRWACAPGRHAPEATLEALRGVVGCAGEVFLQRGADFAERLYQIACDCRAAGYQRLVISSSDSPHLPTDAVAQAFAALDRADVALGPAEDGGYYLIGLWLNRQPATLPDLFRGIRMSTATVCAETLARARALGLTTTLLAPTFDVDEAPDLERLWDVLRHADERLAPRTRLALAALLPTIAPAALLPTRPDAVSASQMGRPSHEHVLKEETWRR